MAATCRLPGLLDDRASGRARERMDRNALAPSANCIPAYPTTFALNPTRLFRETVLLNPGTQQSLFSGEPESEPEGPGIENG